MLQQQAHPAWCFLLKDAKHHPHGAGGAAAPFWQHSTGTLSPRAPSSPSISIALANSFGCVDQQRQTSQHQPVPCQTVPRGNPEAHTQKRGKRTEEGAVLLHFPIIIGIDHRTIPIGKDHSGHSAQPQPTLPCPHPSVPHVHSS